MSTEETAIVASNRTVPVFEINAPIVLAKNAALEKSALIGKVTNHDTKTLAVRAQQELKRITKLVEKSRVEAKEPLLEAGRQLDNCCRAFNLDLEREFGRVSEVVAQFDNEERQRVLEEQRKQQEELERIEREKQAEIARLAREQAAREAEARRIQEEADCKAREATEAAQRLASEAKNRKQREESARAVEEAKRQSEAAAAEKQRQEAIAAQERAKLAAQTAQIEEKAADAAYVAAKPVEITKVAGQVTKRDWEITSINEHQLYRARPDLVTRITFDLRLIKENLSNGVKLPGVIAKEVHKADVRSARVEAINV